MKKHKVLKVAIITLLICALLTWIIPCATYQMEYTEIGRYQVGLFDILSYQSTVLGYFGYVALFVLVVGGFYGVLFKTGAYRAMLDSICKKFKGKETIFVIVIISLFAILTSFAGLQLALLMFFPFVISLLLMMGYSRVATVAVTAGSVAVGLMGTTFAYNTTQVLQEYLSVELTDLIWAKVILLVIGIILLALSVVKFSKKDSLKKEIEKDEFIPEPVKGKAKKRIWPLVIILDLIFLVMVLGFITWSNSFGIDLFTDVYTAVTEFELFGFPIFGKILGAVSPFGYWSLLELITIMILAVIIIKFVYKIKWDEIINAFGKGVKKALLPATIVILIYTVLVLTTYDPYQLVIYKVILGLSKGFNIFTTGLVIVLSSIFNGDPVYAFYSVLPYFVSVVTDTNYYQMIAVIFQALYGIVTLVAPTSIPLMLTLAYTGASYKDWFKYIWKLLVALLVVAFIIFTILLLIV
ncbi:MAG TPA: hypothetical protein IAB45_04145 [Candidatus Onthousia faecavium]|nr:hypothetical protein [Candidatus Onthousia faecavium]